MTTDLLGRHSHLLFFFYLSVWWNLHVSDMSALLSAIAVSMQCPQPADWGSPLRPPVSKESIRINFAEASVHRRAQSCSAELLPLRPDIRRALNMCQLESRVEIKQVFTAVGQRFGRKLRRLWSAQAFCDAASGQRSGNNLNNLLDIAPGFKSYSAQYKAFSFQICSFPKQNVILIIFAWEFFYIEDERVDEENASLAFHLNCLIFCTCSFKFLFVRDYSYLLSWQQCVGPA